MVEDNSPPRELGIRSRAAVHARGPRCLARPLRRRRLRAGPDRPSPFDPEGKGHHGRQAIAAFYDTVIAPSEAITFEITESYLCGDEVADVGIIRTTLAGGTHQAVVHGVYTYRSDGAGKLRCAPRLLGVRRARARGAPELRTAMRVMVREGLFTDGDPPALLGSRCAQLRATSTSPAADACTYCATEDPEPVELSRTGHPVGLDGRDRAAARVPGRGRPTAWAWSSCPRGSASSRRLTVSDPAALAAGQAMELRVVPLHTDDDGNDVVTYAFAPASPRERRRRHRGRAAPLRTLRGRLDDRHGRRRRPGRPPRSGRRQGRVPGRLLWHGLRRGGHRPQGAEPPRHDGHAHRRRRGRLRQRQRRAHAGRRRHPGRAVRHRRSCSAPRRCPRGSSGPRSSSPGRRRRAWPPRPAFFALRAQRLCLTSGVTKDHLARVVVKNRRHGRANPDAMFQKETSVEEVLASRVVCEPLHLFMLCSPNEGAAALVLRRDDRPPPPRRPGHARRGSAALAHPGIGPERVHAPGRPGRRRRAGADDPRRHGRLRAGRAGPRGPRRGRVPGHRRRPRAPVLRGARAVRAGRLGRVARFGRHDARRPPARSTRAAGCSPRASRSAPRRWARSSSWCASCGASAALARWRAPGRPSRTPSAAAPTPGSSSSPAEPSVGQPPEPEPLQSAGQVGQRRDHGVGRVLLVVRGAV